MKAIYSKYGSIMEEQCNDLRQAIDFLNNLEDHTLGYALSIYDEKNRIAYMPQYMGIMGERAEDFSNARLSILRERGMEPLSTEFYK